MTELPHVEIATDGACKGNPGPGGWGALIRMGAKETGACQGGEAHTTNNRMELMAAIEGLNALTRPCRVTLSTDSRYVMDGLTKWIHGWRKNGWRTADKKPVKNARAVAERCAPPRNRTASNGSGSRAMPVTPTTNAPTGWPATLRMLMRRS